MSYDVYISCHTCGADQMNGYNNMTSNCAPLWNHVGAPIRDWHGKTGYQVLPALSNAIRQLSDPDMLPYEREEFEALVRGGGSWGTLETALAFLVRIRDAICSEPLATITVSH